MNVGTSSPRQLILRLVFSISTSKLFVNAEVSLNTSHLSTCPENWTNLQSRCFKIFSFQEAFRDNRDKGSWLEALQICTKEHYQPLATLHQDAESDWILNTLVDDSHHTGPCWIGLVKGDKGPTKKWHWIDDIESAKSDAADRCSAISTTGLQNRPCFGQGGQLSCFVCASSQLSTTSAKNARSIEIPIRNQNLKKNSESYTIKLERKERKRPLALLSPDATVQLFSNRQVADPTLIEHETDRPLMSEPITPSSLEDIYPDPILRHFPLVIKPQDIDLSIETDFDIDQMSPIHYVKSNVKRVQTTNLIQRYQTNQDTTEKEKMIISDHYDMRNSLNHEIEHVANVSTFEPVPQTNFPSAFFGDSVDISLDVPDIDDNLMNQLVNGDQSQSLGREAIPSEIAEYEEPEYNESEWTSNQTHTQELDPWEDTRDSDIGLLWKDNKKLFDINKSTEDNNDMDHSNSLHQTSGKTMEGQPIIPEILEEGKADSMSHTPTGNIETFLVMLPVGSTDVKPSQNINDDHVGADLVTVVYTSVKADDIEQHKQAAVVTEASIDTNASEPNIILSIDAADSLIKAFEDAKRIESPAENDVSGTEVVHGNPLGYVPVETNLIDTTEFRQPVDYINAIRSRVNHLSVPFSTTNKLSEDIEPNTSKDLMFNFLSDHTEWSDEPPIIEPIEVTALQITPIEVVSLEMDNSEMSNEPLMFSPASMRFLERTKNLVEEEMTQSPGEGEEEDINTPEEAPMVSDNVKKGLVASVATLIGSGCVLACVRAYSAMTVDAVEQQDGGSTSSLWATVSDRKNSLVLS